MIRDRMAPYRVPQATTIFGPQSREMAGHRSPVISRIGKWRQKARLEYHL
jgi:hypothetical protein